MHEPTHGRGTASSYDWTEFQIILKTGNNWGDSSLVFLDAGLRDLATELRFTLQDRIQSCFLIPRK